MATGAQGVTGSVTADSSRVLPASALVSLAYQCPKWQHIAPLMAAIALAESGGDPTAENYCCVGLWQVNVLVHTQYTRTQMKDPLANLRAACAIYGSQGLHAWESYTNGAYKKFVPQVEKSLKEGGFNEKVVGAGILGTGIGPDTEQPGNEASEKVKGAVEGAISWTGELGKILSFLESSQGWIRIGKVVLGVTLLVIAIDQLTKIGPGPETNVSGAVGGGASKAGGVAKRSPAGKIVRSRGDLVDAAALGAK